MNNRDRHHDDDYSDPAEDDIQRYTRAGMPEISSQSFHRFGELSKELQWQNWEYAATPEEPLVLNEDLFWNIKMHPFPAFFRLTSELSLFNIQPRVSRVRPMKLSRSSEDAKIPHELVLLF